MLPQLLLPIAEVFAAREKNGVYIPRDRYLIEEAEKKVSLKLFKLIPSKFACAYNTQLQFFTYIYPSYHSL